ncbi:DUF6732 family protein [Tropicimonas marinistellae]|uniref:DUF6732 family protein n=1 Tax=Tropicimonas marinistellae TaxID=1739787 RepID=UPI001373698B|nr:DUF6732 family protein [Tropicimonas marinistellae]
MKRLALVTFALSALPAVAHEAHSLAEVHAHPHGMEAVAVGLAALLVSGYAIWRTRNR